LKSTPGQRFRDAVASEHPLQVVGAINANHALLAKRAGFKAIYLSGGGVAAGSLGLPDLGITGLDDVLTDVRRITDVCDLPLLVDVDTGFGASAFNVARTVKSMIKFGAAAIHIEDQVGAKRCGHRPNKEIVTQQEMVDRIKAAVDARTDDSFVIMARTDAWRWKAWTPPGPRRRLHRGRRRHDLPGSHHRTGDVQAVRRPGEGADPGQHHRIRRDAAVHHRRTGLAPTCRWCCTRCRRSAP
jgi:hypothetical protein